MIHFFSGLFGEDEMWSAYKDLGTNLVHKLNNNSIKYSPNDILIGYSMGGRIAMKIARQCNFEIKKLVLLSAHPGLDEKEKGERRIWEDDILFKMDSLGKDHFLEFWDSLPLFSMSKTSKTMSDLSFSMNREYFIKNRLSEQPNYLKELELYSDKILYIFGKHDTRYANIAKELRLKSINCIAINSDHRVHLRPEELIPILKREIFR